MEDIKIDRGTAVLIRFPEGETQEAINRIPPEILNKLDNNNMSRIKIEETYIEIIVYNNI